MNINDLTLGQIKEIGSYFQNDKSSSGDGLNDQVGEQVIIRTYSAGVWFGTLDKKSGAEVILKNARRMHYWKAKKSISLSGVAVHGVDSESKICPAVKMQWLEAVEIISVNRECIKTIEACQDVEAR